ncbi:MAG: rRNA maturation RNase YbeY [Verrucomicrobiota bacterium]
MSIVCQRFFHLGKRDHRREEWKMETPELNLNLYDHQQVLPLNLPQLTALAEAALPLVLAQTGPEVPVLPDLMEVEVSFITDEAIAKVHAEFLEDPTPTDVITFAHGEILISTETALRQAVEHGQTPEREVALYLIHGLLHLNGHEDESDTGFLMMKRLQEGILASVWPEDDRKP